MNNQTLILEERQGANLGRLIHTGYHLTWHVMGEPFQTPIYRDENQHPWTPYDQLAVIAPSGRETLLLDLLLSVKQKMPLDIRPLLTALEPVVRGQFFKNEYFKEPTPGLLKPEFEEMGFIARQDGCYLFLYWSPNPESENPGYIYLRNYEVFEDEDWVMEGESNSWFATELHAQLYLFVDANPNFRNLNDGFRLCCVRAPSQSLVTGGGQA